MARPGRRVRTAQERRRAAGALGLLAGTVALSAKAASGGFGGGVTPTHAADTGDLHLTLTEDTDQAFTATLDNLYPDDFGGEGGYQRLVTVTNGATGFATVTLSTSDSCATDCQESLLTDDTTNGLKLLVEKCSQPWVTDGGSSPKKTYACNGTKTTVYGFAAAVPASQPISLTAQHNLTDGGTTYYRFWFKLPSGLVNNSPDSHQNETSKIKFTFDGTQRAGTNR